MLRVEPGIVRVADAKGQPPSIPFWLGEAPGRTRELSSAIADLRESAAARRPRRVRGRARPRRRPPARGVRSRAGRGGALQIAEYVLAGRRALGAVPTQRRVVLERFFDESGGTQLVVHAPFGSRINRAWGLALRKRFCVGLRLRAAGRRQRGGHRPEPRAAAQLPARGRLRLPASQQRSRGPRAGPPRRSDVRDAVALERAALADAGAPPQRQEDAGRRSSA